MQASLRRFGAKPGGQGGWKVASGMKVGEGERKAQGWYQQKMILAMAVTMDCCGQILVVKIHFESLIGR